MSGTKARQRVDNMTSRNVKTYETWTESDGKSNASILESEVR